MKKENALVVFQGKDIRRIWYKDSWFFSIIDVTAILTDQSDPLKARKYWNKLKQRLKAEGSEMVTICHQLKLPAADGKYYATDCANTESLFRIIQSVPSPKAEPFKRWLAEAGYERIQEIENPELAQDRAKEYYELKEYPQDGTENVGLREKLNNSHFKGVEFDSPWVYVNG